jgi:hypothetical protein
MNPDNISLGAIGSVSIAGLLFSDPFFSTEGNHIYSAQDCGVITIAKPGTGDIFL